MATIKPTDRRHDLKTNTVNSKGFWLFLVVLVLIAVAYMTIGQYTPRNMDEQAATNAGAITTDNPVSDTLAAAPNTATTDTNTAMDDVAVEYNNPPVSPHMNPTEDNSTGVSGTQPQQQNE